MAHIHVAIFQWKDGVKTSEVDEALELVRGVSERVEGVNAIYCGKNTSRWGKNYTHMVVVVADSADALERYRGDEIHVKAARIIEGMELDGIGVDIADPE